eukprot:16442226-Heterocapsa_arctica.AAC.1
MAAAAPGSSLLGASFQADQGPLGSLAVAIPTAAARGPGLAPSCHALRFQFQRRPSLVPLLARLAAGPDGVLFPVLTPFPALAVDGQLGRPRRRSL